MKGISQVQASHGRPVRRAVFDEPNLLSAVGLVPVVALADRVGLRELVDDPRENQRGEYLRPRRRRRPDPTRVNAQVRASVRCRIRVEVIGSAVPGRAAEPARSRPRSNSP